jgi:hypothetical protein
MLVTCLEPQRCQGLVLDQSRFWCGSAVPSAQLSVAELLLPPELSLRLCWVCCGSLMVH